jgi:hypothetical protein
MRLKACGRQTVTVTCTGTGCKDITLINSIIPCVEGDEGSTRYHSELGDCTQRRMRMKSAEEKLDLKLYQLSNCNVMRLCAAHSCPIQLCSTSMVQVVW